MSTSRPPRARYLLFSDSVTRPVGTCFVFVLLSWRVSLRDVSTRMIPVLGDDN